VAKSSPIGATLPERSAKGVKKNQHKLLSMWSLCSFAAIIYYFFHLHLVSFAFIGKTPEREIGGISAPFSALQTRWPPPAGGDL
jgi:hypothetical protein